MRESWTDERLDDFAKHVDQRFDQVDQRFDGIERRMEHGFNRVDTELRAISARFDALQRTMLQIAGGTIATLVVGFAGVIATQL